jgi:protein-disulfide isomerase
MKNKLFVLGAVALAALALIVLKFSKPSQTLNEPVPERVAQVSLVRAHSPTFGNTLARVTVVEWFDPQCEACRAIHPAVKKIMNDYSDRVRFVFRYMPYHSGSMIAASALEEARELGKFKEALELLFEKQPEWGDHHQPRTDLIPGYLATLGIPKDKLDREYLLKKHTETIRLDEADGNGVGVQGTPTFLVNGQPLSELGEEPLRAAIDSALNTSNAR